MSPIGAVSMEGRESSWLRTPGQSEGNEAGGSGWVGLYCNGPGKMIKARAWGPAMGQMDRWTGRNSLALGIPLPFQKREGRAGSGEEGPLWVAFLFKTHRHSESPHR